MSKILNKLAAIAAVALVSGPALAVPTTWNYSGTCNSGNCSVTPTISGSLSGDPAIDWPSNVLSQLFDAGELTSYSFNVGGFVFSGTSAVGSYVLDAAGNIIGGSMVFAETGFFTLDLLGLDAFSWSFSHDNLFGRDYQASGTGSFTRATSVAEPATLALFGLGLLGFGLTRRRRI